MIFSRSLIGLGLCSGFLQFVDGEERQKVFSDFLIRNHLVHLGQNRLHRFKHDPLTGDFLGFPIFLKDGIETIGFTFGNQSGLFRIALCGGDDLLCVPPSLGNQVVLVTFGINDQLFPDFTGTDHIL